MESSLVSKLYFLLLVVTSAGIWLWSDALTVETPFLVPFLPEGLKLGSYLVLMKGISTFFLFFIPVFMRKGVVAGCFACYLLSLVFSVLLIFIWQLPLPNHHISAGFLISAFFLMGLDSCRMTLVFTLAGNLFSEPYMTACLIGDALGGLLASIVSYAQGSKELFTKSRANELKQPNSIARNSTASSDVELDDDFLFGPTVALIILTCFFAVSFLGFILLIYLYKYFNVYESLSESEASVTGRVSSGLRTQHGTECSSDSGCSKGGTGTGSGGVGGTQMDSCSKNLLDQDSHVVNESSPLMDELADRTEFSTSDEEKKPKIVKSGLSVSCRVSRAFYTRLERYVLYVTWMISSGSIFTVAPAFHSFSTTPYSEQCYILSVSGWSLAFPLTAVFTHYFRVKRVPHVALLAAFHLAVTGFLVYIAAQNPSPPLVHYRYGFVFLILLWILQSFTGYYVFSISSICLRSIGGSAITWGTVFAQIGDVLGSLISFCLVNFTSIFEGESA